MQAKSPMRSLDELNITEVPSTPYFPSITERTLSNLNNGDPLACSNQPKSETAGVTTNVGEVEGSTEGDSFGRRRRHRCYVVTARSRGFLYHQVWFLFIVCISWWIMCINCSLLIDTYSNSCPHVLILLCVKLPMRNISIWFESVRDELWCSMWCVDF